MDREPIRDGAIVLAAGAVVDVGPADLLSSRFPDAKIVDRSDCTVLPGLVNAHTHLELSEFSCGRPAASFVDWIMRLVPRGQATAESVQQSVARSVPIGIAQCLRFGVTCVGDISRHCTATRPLLSGGPLRVVSYGEVQAMAQRRELLEQRIAAAIDGTFASPHLLIAITPHAPYSVEPNGYRRCLEVAREHNLPLATHLAETPDEATFLSRHAGPFRELWDYLGAWDQSVPAFNGGPIRLADSLGLLDHPTLLAHVNYCDDDELALLARGRASVVYCPRTHAYFGHPPHRWREMLTRGINVALGTDSCASAPDLDLVEELRNLRRLAPDVPPDRLWEMATIRAAGAVRMDDRIGTLTPGKAADLIVFRADGNDPLATILDSKILPAEVWIAGVVCSTACQAVDGDG